MGDSSAGEGVGTVVGREDAVAPAAGPEDQELDSVINGSDLLGEEDDLDDVDESDDDLVDETDDEAEDEADELADETDDDEDDDEDDEDDAEEGEEGEEDDLTSLEE